MLHRHPRKSLGTGGSTVVAGPRSQGGGGCYKEVWRPGADIGIRWPGGCQADDIVNTVLQTINAMNEDLV